jgi:hypothetical protein
MTENKKTEYLSENFTLLNDTGKDLLTTISRQLLDIQFSLAPRTESAQQDYERREPGCGQRRVVRGCPGGRRVCYPGVAEGTTPR